MAKLNNEDIIRRLMVFDDISEHEDNTHRITEMMDGSIAAMVRGANFNAHMDDDINQPKDLRTAKSKIQHSATLDMKVINHFLNQKFPDIVVLYKEVQSSRVVQYGEMKNFTVISLDDKRMVFSMEYRLREVDDNGNEEPFKKGYIEYKFKPKQFYRVNFYASGIRRITSIQISHHSTDIVQRYLSEVHEFLKYQAKYENYITKNGPTPSKIRNPKEEKER